MQCPNCKKDAEKTSENEVYCKECDLTFVFSQGKAKAQTKGKIQELEEKIAYLEKEQQDLKKDLYGDSPLPFLD